MSILRLENVSKKFGGVRAISDLTLALREKQITSLIGPNGAGKTTVVNLVTGLYALSTGTISFKEADVTRLEPAEIARCGISRTFQGIRLLKDQTVLENILSGFHRHQSAGLVSNCLGLPSSRKEKRAFTASALDFLSLFQMEKFADLPAGALSYGHQRRVEILRALASRPELLILDEPAAGMNDVEASTLGRFFKDLVASGMSILLIEHNMRLVMSVSDVVHVIDAGRYVTGGEPEKVIKDERVIEAYLGAEVA